MRTRHVLVGMVLLGLVACGRPEGAQENQAGQVEGPIQVMDGATWVVADRLVTLAPNAQVAGQPTIGAVVRLASTRTPTGQLVADRVEVVRGARPGHPGTPPVATTKDAAVPNLVGKPVTAASNLLDEAGLVVGDVHTRPVEPGQVGAVLEQEPGPDATLKAGDPVELVVGVADTVQPAIGGPTPPQPAIGRAAPSKPAAPARQKSRQQKHDGGGQGDD